MNKSKKKNIYLWLIFIVGVFLIINGVMVAPDDFLMHVTFGKWIVEHRQIPTYGIGSWYTVANQVEYIYHEWLAGVIFVFYEKLFGLFPGEWIFIQVHMTILVLLLFGLTAKEWKDKTHVLIYWIMAGIGTLGAIMSARPLWYGITFFVVEMWALERLKRNPSSKGIWLIPLMAIGWGNLHGGSVALSYIFIGMYIALWVISNICKPMKHFEVVKQEKQVLKKLLLALPLTIVGSCCNPYGYKMFFYTLSHYVGKTDHKWVFEWQPANIEDTPLTFMFLGFLIAFFYIYKKKIEITDAILMSAFAFLCLTTYRYLPWFYVAMSFVIWRYVDEKKETIPYRVVVYGICGIILIIATFVEAGIRGISSKIWLSDEAWEAIDELEYERIYTNNAIGQILLWGGYVNFLDGRGDMYSSIDVSEELSLLDEAMYWERCSSKVDWRAYMDKYQFEVYITKSEASINYYLKEQEDLDLYYQDDDICIFVVK